MGKMTLRPLQRDCQSHFGEYALCNGSNIALEQLIHVEKNGEPVPGAGNNVRRLAFDKESGKCQNRLVTQGEPVGPGLRPVDGGWGHVINILKAEHQLSNVSLVGLGLCHFA